MIQIRQKQTVDWHRHSHLNLDIHNINTFVLFFFPFNMISLEGISFLKLTQILKLSQDS